MGHLALAHAALHLLDGQVHLASYHFGYSGEMGGPPSPRPLHWVGSSKRRSAALNGISVEEGSGSVYADLGYAGSEATLIKARLITEIAEIIRNRGLTQGQAAALLGLTQPKVSSLLKGRFRSISERRLLDCLARLGSSPTIHNPRSTIQSYARIA